MLTIKHKRILSLSMEFGLLLALIFIATGCGGSNTSDVFTTAGVATDRSKTGLNATSALDNDETAEADNNSSNSRTLLREGDYAFYYNGDKGNDEETYPVWSAGAGRFHADGFGNITDGMMDMNLPSGVFTSVQFTGTYSVEPDFRGSLEIYTAEGDFSYLMTVDLSGTGGKFISDDLSAAVSGYFELQDESALSLSAIAGPYAIGISSGYRETAAVGRFDIDGTGNISGGRIDVREFVHNDGFYKPSYAQDLALTGFISEPSSSTGRGTATMVLPPTHPGGTDTYSFVYYIVSDQKILLVQTDERSFHTTILSGAMQRQEGLFTSSSFDAPAIFSLSGLSVYATGVTIGRIVPDGAGSITGAIDSFSDLEDIFPPVRNEEFWGSYSIESDGRSEIALEMNPAFVDSDPFPLSRNMNRTYIAYFFGQNQGFLMGPLSIIGGFKPQDPGLFTSESISGTFLTSTMPGLSNNGTERISGLTTFDFAGNFSSSMDITQDSGTSHREFNGQYTVTINGRGTVMSEGAINPKIVFWIISPSELVAVSTMGNYGERVLVEYRR